MRFIEGAVKNGIKKDIAASIFLKIEPFAEYGFNKSHAAAYAIIAYQTAYLKNYYQKEFFSASMSMDISNQNKLSEFFEELKRLGINVKRPDINQCYADFQSNEKNFFYALGAIKNVGYEAISNIVNERDKNGKFVSIIDFINRVNPKDINKLQLEGLVKAGAFDNIIQNRRSLYESIPSIILKSKNNHENKIANQINLFETNEIENNEVISFIDDWDFDVKLSKEFEALGFYISDHPLNQYSDVLGDYEIISFENFNNNKNIHAANIAGTVLKVQQKKTQKGNSYAIVKFSDLKSVFELFIFSDLLELNRDIISDGNSLILNLTKNTTEENNRFKKINVKNLSSLSSMINKPIENIEIKIKNSNFLDKIKQILTKSGDTNVQIRITEDAKDYAFKLKNKRLVDRSLINLLKKQGITTNIF